MSTVVTDETKYLGSAIKYPLVLTNGRPEISNGKQAVREGIMTLLSESIGSRFFLRDYGCRNEELLFEPNDAVLLEMLKTYTYEALSYWERRVRFITCEFEVSESKIDMSITYEVLQSSEVDSFVYPFYRTLIH